MTNDSEILPDGTFILGRPVPLPEVLDMLIVGGGPAGTAAAFRARELGLTALVIDYDDLMKRIRDYAADKPILPNFGGGDQISFPQGGELISQLAFSEIDKDEMCRQWKGIYRRHNIPAQLGIELLALEEAPRGLWSVKAWNHHAKAEQHFTARHVVIAVGRGVPRTFDIPGNLQGMAFRLSDPAHQVGSPACIIGGGTSAAEAVIAISNAKAQAGDASAVYWSSRGEKMPKVSRALAEVFLDAFAGNGNIRYLPNSEPVSVFRAPDHRDYLCLRVARKQLEGRPVETIHLEFLKEYCIACIGEDLPVSLLNSLGIFQLSGGPKNRKRLAVSPLLETPRPNLYLIGDMLSPAYLESEDFEGDPSGFPEIKRRGNVKSALRDGVLVSEVIHQKLQGRTDIRVRVRFEEPSPEGAQRSPEQPAAVPRPPGARLVRIQEGNLPMDEFPLRSEVTSIGNRGCDINFEHDSSLSDRHATIAKEPQGYVLRDEGSREGVFLQPAAGRAVKVTDGMVVRAGNQWLVFGGAGSPHSLAQYDSRGKEVRRIQLQEGTIVLGRQAHVNLDPSDGALSRRHLSISVKEGKRFIRDLESVNGTHLKVDAPTAIHHGDRIWLGSQVLRLSSSQEPGPAAEVHHDTQSKLASPVAPTRGRPEGTPDPSLANGLMVRFENLGKTLPIRNGQTICELAEEHGLKIAAQCHRGICGSDPIRIISGQENLNPITEGEEDTLDDLCSIDDGQHRLACMARASGPVVVEIIDN
ncbi:MAG: FHA domain-containing protein [Acidobacteriota bacterium]